MTTPGPEYFISFADHLLAEANTEMHRAEEDVVTHLICSNTRQSIINYLTGFLLSKEILPEEPLSPEGLLKQCAGIDHRFRNLDLSPVYCRFDTDDAQYCLDVEKVAQCLRIAHKMEGIVKSGTLSDQPFEKVQ